MARKLSPGVHNIRIKKPGGGTRMQRVKVLKSGKFKFIKNVKGAAKPKAKKAAKPRGKARRTSPTRRRKPRMARRKSSLPNRLINFGLLLLAFSPAIKRLLEGAPIEGTIDIYTGGALSGQFPNKDFLVQAYMPVVASFVLFEVKKMAMKKFRF